MDTSQVGLIGLGVMGRNLVLNMARNGFRLAIYNRTTQVTRDLADANPAAPLTVCDNPQRFIAALTRPRRIIIMVKAGTAVDQVIETLTPMLEPGDLLVDGGNSFFRDTERREARLRESGLLYMGVGISGGEQGALRGPSIMPGGAHGGMGDAQRTLRVRRREGRRTGLRHPHRAARIGALRENGAQRHRVRSHATHRRGI